MFNVKLFKLLGVFALIQQTCPWYAKAMHINVDLDKMLWLRLKGGKELIGVHALDFEDAVDEIQEKEIEIVFGPEDIRKGKTVVFLDPDGNQIELSYPMVG